MQQAQAAGAAGAPAPAAPHAGMGLVGRLILTAVGAAGAGAIAKKGFDKSTKTCLWAAAISGAIVFVVSTIVSAVKRKHAELKQGMEVATAMKQELSQSLSAKELQPQHLSALYKLSRDGANPEVLQVIGPWMNSKPYLGQAWRGVLAAAEAQPANANRNAFIALNLLEVLKQLGLEGQMPEYYDIPAQGSLYTANPPQAAGTRCRVTSPAWLFDGNPIAAGTCTPMVGEAAPAAAAPQAPSPAAPGGGPWTLPDDLHTKGMLAFHQFASKLADDVAATWMAAYGRERKKDDLPARVLADWPNKLNSLPDTRERGDLLAAWNAVQEQGISKPDAAEEILRLWFETLQRWGVSTGPETSFTITPEIAKRYEIKDNVRQGTAVVVRPTMLYQNQVLKAGHAIPETVPSGQPSVV